MNSKYKFNLDPQTQCLSDEDTKKYFSRLGLAVFTMCIGFSAVSGLLVALVKYIVDGYFPELMNSSVFIGLFNQLSSMIPLYCVALPIFILMTKPLPKVVPSKGKMGALKWLGGLCIAELAMMTGSYISNMLLVIIETAANTTTKNPVAEVTAQSNVWITIIFMCILTPLLEELFFRKIVCDRLLVLGEGYAVFVSSALFGLIHRNFYQFAYAFLVGLIFSFIYVKTGKIRYSAIYHMILNFFGAVVAPYLIEQIQIERLINMLETGVFDYDLRLLIFMGLTLAYEGIMMVAGIVGLVLLIKAKHDGNLKLDTGILPPPKKHRVANIFCTVGVAAAITYFTVFFVLSLLM